jgi:hypothetical protein
VAANTGASTAAGGGVLAIGLALRAELSWLGWTLAVIGLAWIIWTLSLALAVTRKTDRFRQELAKAMRRGEELFTLGAPKPDVEEWQAAVQDMIIAALGEAENRRFLSSAGYVNFGGTHRLNFVRGRLRRLDELAERGNLRVDLRFDHRREWIDQG